eukprot:gb/GECH01007224.1/.p1 GENE.gb/GECH01007224.1/~~gb/GECH01007224.1/.p1  ORF type:complete len:156 (+),score=11.66 gb/GECH01007224.1/:1-468(+)
MEDHIVFDDVSITGVVDDSEQKVRKPVTKEREQLCYSGKKAIHTLTKLGLCSEKGRILWISDTYEGSRYDLTLGNLPENWIQDQKTAGEWLLGDKSWEGQEKNRVISPIKGKNLLTADNAYNNELAKYRIIMETFLAKLKNLKFASIPFELKSQI